MAEQGVQGTSPQPGPPGGVERRKNPDRRGDGRTRDSFGGIGHRSGSFFDHPWWVVGTVVFGVLVGMLIMLATSAPVVPTTSTRTTLPTGGVEVIVKPESGTNGADGSGH